MVRVALIAILVPSALSQDLASCMNWIDIQHDCIRGRQMFGGDSDVDCDEWYTPAFTRDCVSLPENSDRCIAWVNPAGYRGSLSGDYPFSRPGTKSECTAQCAKYGGLSNSACGDPETINASCLENCERWCESSPAEMENIV